MKKFLSIIILGLLLEGCATQSNYKALLDTWVGGTEDQLINSWGPPNGLYNKPDGGKILTFAWSGSYSLPGYPSTSSSTNMGVTTTVTTVPSDTIIQTGCKTNFYFSPEGRITTWRFQGNSCVSNYKKPNDGQGTQTHKDGGKFVGEYKDGKKNGQGILSFPNGDRYDGEFKNNKPDGQGTFTYASGSKYVGEYKNGKINGQGTFTASNGNKYVGEFKDNERHGQGTFKWAKSGNIYVGEYKNNKLDGQGVLKSLDGTKQIGGWKDGKLNGQASYIFPDGRKLIGEWKDNKFIK